MVPGLNEVIDGARATDEIITEVRRFLVRYMQLTLKYGSEMYPRELSREEWRRLFRTYLKGELDSK